MICLTPPARNAGFAAINWNENANANKNQKRAAKVDMPKNYPRQASLASGGTWMDVAICESFCFLFQFHVIPLNSFCTNPCHEVQFPAGA
jgi:hypothetical protein